MSMGTPKMPMTLPMFCGPTACRMMVMPMGISMPPPMPWSTRKKISSPRFWETPHSIDATVNVTMVMR